MFLLNQIGSCHAAMMQNGYILRCGICQINHAQSDPNRPTRFFDLDLCKSAYKPTRPTARNFLSEQQEIRLELGQAFLLTQSLLLQLFFVTRTDPFIKLKFWE